MLFLVVNVMSVHHKEITDQNLIRIADAMRTWNPCTYKNTNKILTNSKWSSHAGGAILKKVSSDSWFGMTEIDYIYIYIYGLYMNRKIK